MERGTSPEDTETFECGGKKCADIVDLIWKAAIKGSHQYGFVSGLPYNATATVKLETQSLPLNDSFESRDVSIESQSIDCYEKKGFCSENGSGLRKQYWLQKYWGDSRCFEWSP